MVFLGEYEVSFSGGGRIVLPKKIRVLLKGNIFILTKGSNDCLSGYDKKDWEKRTKELTNISLLTEDNIAKKRVVFSSTVYLEIDEQGRFVIPRNLMLHAYLNDKAAIIGVGDHFEVWEPQKWDEYIKSVHPSGVQARKL